MKEEANAGEGRVGGRRGEMCGIFACLNYNVKRERRYILQVLFMASFPILVFRQEGNIESLVKSVYQEVDATDLNLEESFLTLAGISHKRWATHGEPAPRNSHPLLQC